VTSYRITVAARIDAPPADVYRVLADHRRGHPRAVRAAVTEPRPGRVLVETDLERGTATTFAVNAVPFFLGCEVTIATELHARPGLLGRIERLVTTRLLRRIYRDELALLAAVVAERVVAECDECVTSAA
jgi:hypothetical protein